MFDLFMILWDTLTGKQDELIPVGKTKIVIDFPKPKVEPQEVVIKPDSFDIQAIQEYTGQTNIKFEFRPQTLKEFIGQKEAKAKVLTLMKKVNRNMKGHCLIDGIQGLSLIHI